MSILLLSLLLIALAFIVFVVWSIQQRYSKVNQRVEKRLQAMMTINKGIPTYIGGEVLMGNRARILEWLLKHRWAKSIDKKLMMSGRDFKLDEFLLVTSVAGVLALAISMALGVPFLVCMLATVLASYVPYALLGMMIRRRQDALERQLPDVLDFIARSMQAGHSFSSSMQMAATESPEPIAFEFLIASNKINYGESVHNALSGLAQRIECSDMSYFAVAVLINREIGGDLAALLKSVSELIRGRLQLRMSIHALTGEARASAMILGLIPFILALVLTVLQPKMMSVLITDPTGRQLLGYGLLIMGFGVLWMRKLIRIKI